MFRLQGEAGILKRRPWIKSGALAAVMLIGFTGCAPINMPKVNLSEPQWRVHRGQVLWEPPSGRMELTGDLVAAENIDHDVWVGMTKALLPIFTARTWNGTWSIDFVKRGESYQGRGKPPVGRFIWFDLPQILDGAVPPKPWRIRRDEDRVILKNPRTGEEITMVFE
jgi:hypothetical protein